MRQSFGIIGLGVMGKNLARNLAGKGISLSLFNRFEKGVEENVAVDFISHHAELSTTLGFENLSAFVQSLEGPRKILLMVKAGVAVDAVLQELRQFLAPGDIIIDGGNSHYKDTQRRIDSLKMDDIQFIGCGISGGEAGALNGPSMMPGGDQKTYNLIAPILEMIAAKDKSDNPCCTFIGTGGAGHFVKMVHNGIEYAEMQLLAEIYYIIRVGMGKTPDEIAAVFESWNDDGLGSYLLEITVNILRKKEGNGWLIDQILDQAGNKGTGSWTTIAAAELGVPITMITSALFARYVSAFKSERLQANAMYRPITSGKLKVTSQNLKNAYRTSRLINHHQGFHLLSAASESFGWQLNLSEIARVWTNGCIIRSGLMEELVDNLANTNRLLKSPAFSSKAKSDWIDLANVIASAVHAGLAVPCLSAGIQFLNGYTCASSPANIIQAQRDYFGAHTYRRVGDESGESNHTDWLEDKNK